MQSPYARRHQSGLSLVELMMVLAIGLLMAAVGTALTGAWVDQAAVRQSEAQLRQAVAELKALALRNAEGRPMGEAAAVLLNQPGQLCVLSGQPAQASCENARLQAQPSATVRLAGADRACLAMDSSGRLIDTQIGNTACGNELSYRVQRNKESLDGSLD
ncbi:MAG: type II secretion system protein [Roseateles asaccharophilus]|uniref:Prepilin-type N-terminal cleavage/methylation domain-containing protein n=1 Tax=Roseateles asaccharophilus TaxID=582607 RepID=A0A4R6NBH5_9BURK|nr:prepilin-type N-terminal cleavage/methylation domain-containing protein [Roseateles asaccharophilus]MDN3543628.1 prepilin-type N-terminal cleavage/methylation domain-containing protein [Roseateles asaccharophilus]TDP11994.1 prepilin-type N-terminal cleavage/methylation domain-containing protein [Roseateles asaccharophilus]